MKITIKIEYNIITSQVDFVAYINHQ